MSATPGLSARSDLRFLMTMATGLVVIGSYAAVEWGWTGRNFMPVFGLLSGLALLNVFLFARISGRDYWTSLPAMMIVYLLLALFVPTSMIYASPFLRENLNWDDSLILESIRLGMVFMWAIWLSYRIGLMTMPRLGSSRLPAQIPLGRIFLLLGLALAANFLAIVTGTFGVLQKADVSETSKYLAYVDLGQNLGFLGLIILMIQYPRQRFLVLGFTLLLFFIGIVSAQKQAALMPLMVLGVAYFFQTRRLPLTGLAIGAVAVFFVFASVTTIRKYYFSEGGSGVTSLSDVSRISSGAMNTKVFNKAYDEYSVDQHILIRLFYGSAIGKAISYCERKGYGVPENSRLSHTLMAPVYAIVPRFLLPDKPEANFGNWFASTVYVGYKVKYSIGITPVGYGFMIGGAWGVFGVALILGFFMAFLYRLLWPNHMYIYILVFVKTFLPADVTWEFIAGNLKLVLVYMVILFLLRVRINAAPRLIAA